MMMVNTKYDGVLKELAALLVPHLMAHPDIVQALAFDPSLVEDVVQSKMDELGPIDKSLIREVCEEVMEAADIESLISDHIVNNFDISDYETEIRDMATRDLHDEIETYLKTNLHDEVQTAIQGLSFTVEVSTR